MRLEVKGAKVLILQDRHAGMGRAVEGGMTTTQRTAKILYTLAEQADERFSETVRSRQGQKVTRWAADMRIPEVREAYKAKLAADEAWLTFLRTSRGKA